MVTLADAAMCAGGANCLAPGRVPDRLRWGAPGWVRGVITFKIMLVK
jgi:hypothetical protein